MPKDQAPATIPADSPIRRLCILALIDATKHPQIHGHPTICQTAAQIAPVLTKEMMATPTISLAMMSLMQTLAVKDAAMAIHALFSAHDNLCNPRIRFALKRRGGSAFPCLPNG